MILYAFAPVLKFDEGNAFAFPSLAFPLIKRVKQDVACPQILFGVKAGHQVDRICGSDDALRRGSFFSVSLAL